MSHVITLADCEQLPKVKKMLDDFRQTRSVPPALVCLQKINSHFIKHRVSLLQTDNEGLVAHFLSLPPGSVHKNLDTLSEHVASLTGNQLTEGGLYDLSHQAAKAMNFPWLEMFFTHRPAIALTSLLQNMSSYGKWLLDKNTPSDQIMAVGRFLFDRFEQDDRSYGGTPQSKTVFALTKLHQYQPQAFIELASPHTFAVMDRFLQTSYGASYGQAVSDMKKSWLTSLSNPTSTPQPSPRTPKL